MIQHLLEDEVNDLLDSRLAPAIEAERLRHVDSCQVCLENVNRIGAVIAAGATLRQPAMPEHDLWPQIARRTVRAGPRWSGPWLFTIPFAVLVISLTSLWVVETRPWERGPVVERLQNIGPSDVEMLGRLADLEELQSNSGKREALERMRAGVFGAQNRNVLSRFFSVVATIRSDADRSGVLLSLANYSADTAVARSVIEATISMTSSSAKASVLSALAQRGAISTASLRDLYVGVAERIKSGTERKRALDALGQ